jgi:hypothetical protein
MPRTLRWEVWRRLVYKPTSTLLLYIPHPQLLTRLEGRHPASNCIRFPVLIAPTHSFVPDHSFDMCSSADIFLLLLSIVSADGWCRRSASQPAFPLPFRRVFPVSPVSVASPGALVPSRASAESLAAPGARRSRRSRRVLERSRRQQQGLGGLTSVAAPRASPPTRRSALNMKFAIVGYAQGITSPLFPPLSYDHC